MDEDGFLSKKINGIRRPGTISLKSLLFRAGKWVNLPVRAKKFCYFQVKAATEVVSRGNSEREKEAAKMRENLKSNVNNYEVLH